MRMQLHRASSLMLGLGIAALTLLPTGRVALGSDHGSGLARVRGEHRLERVQRRLERRSLRHARRHARRYARRTAESHRGGFHTRLRSCGCTEVYRPARWEIVYERVRLPGHYERVWVPARFVTRLQFGCEIRVKITSGHWERVYKPGRYKEIRKRVRVPGGYVSRGTCRH